MADKELTVFLLDASAPSSAYKYALDVLAGKLLKGLKTDFVTVAIFNSTDTNHASKHTGKFRGIEVLLDFQLVSFRGLGRIHERLCVAETLNPHPKECADVVQTVLFASTLFVPTKNKAFTRNIVLVTRPDVQLLSSSLDSICAVPKFYADYLINFNIVLANTCGSQLPEDCVLSKLRNVFPAGTAFCALEAKNLYELHPPIKKTRPMALYMGDMRLGSDFSRMAQIVGFEAKPDMACASFRVELYAAAKGDTSSLAAHEYLVGSDGITKIEHRTSHYVWEHNFQGDAENAAVSGPVDPGQEKKFDKVVVDLHSLTPAFKFSNFDLIALDDDLKQASKLPLFSGLDIFAFIPEKRVSLELLTGEAMYVVPEKALSVKNTLNFQAFVEALRMRKLAALCRFVRKLEKEVEIGAAFPVRIKCELGHTSCLVFIRLPFKEDEKIGRFPLLTEKLPGAQPETQPGVECTSIALLMDEFVNARTYESDDEPSETSTHNASVIENFKVTMKTGDGSKLPLPPKRRNTSPFLCLSPAASRHQMHMRRLLLSSLSATDWTAHFENPKFIAEHLRDLEQATNFFNLQNCLAVNSQAACPNLLAEMTRESLLKGKRLVSELQCEYVQKSEKKIKTETLPGFFQRGNYGADEGNYDEIPDFGF